MKNLLVSFFIFILSTTAFGQNYDKLWQLYSDGNFEEVVSLSKSELDKNSNDPDLNSLAGRSLTELQNYYEAVPYLENVVSNNATDAPSKAWALNYLGKCYFALGDYRKSQNCLEECFELNATKNATNSSKGWYGVFGFDSYFDDWKTIETEHFIFHIQPNTKIRGLEKFIEEREDAFTKINSYFGSSIPKKTDYFFWNLNRDAHNVGIEELGYAKPEYCLIHSLCDQSVGHEMTHVITHHLTMNPKKVSLINEGTAVHFDQTGLDKLEIAKSRLKNKYVSILGLWENWETLSSDISYPLAGAFVKHLLEKGGKEKFIELLKNQTFDNAALIYGEQLGDIIAEFEESLMK